MMINLDMVAPNATLAPPGRLTSPPNLG
jgi:hypothetical protein